MTDPEPSRPEPVELDPREAVAMLMAQHGGARYADPETIAACLGAGRDRGAPSAP